ncbi:hypothetical protein RCG67_02495 [Kocuria sp. CPCC 205292]|uniref:hypothetical protein n=1 Tax=Kocuria cellulosilytica TaxID=3071451 RepID=UPI0034D508A1
MSPTTSRSARALGAAALLLLASCAAPTGGEPSGEGTGPTGSPTATAAGSPTGSEPATGSPSPASASPTADPTGSPTTGPTASPTVGPTATPTPGPTGSPAPAELVTHSGTAADAAFAFELPATWRVDGEFSGVGGTVTVVGPDGAPLGYLTVLQAWGAECGPDCTQPAVVHLGDVPGEAALSSSGEFVVRSVAMDLTSSPRLRNVNGWQDNVRLMTSLTDADTPPPTAMLPHVMYGLGLVETGVVASNGITYRTVIFSSAHDFPTIAAAEEYVASEEHRQIQAMIASFRA